MSSEKSTILYVDDDLFNLELFEELFKDFYHVITLSSSLDAAEVLKNNEVKVIITDQCMPDENGIEFIKRITPAYPDTIKMMLTAYSNHDVALEAINDAGIYKYFLKPLDPVEIRNSINIAIREYDLRRENKALLVKLRQNNAALAAAYKQLKENEIKFYTIFSKSNDCIYIIDKNKRITEVNQAFCELFGFVAVCDTEVTDHFIRSKYPVLLSKPIELVESNSASAADLEIKLKSGETKYLELNCNSISYNNDNYILAVIHDVSERRLFERKIVETIIKTQEDSQSRYARELHDGLGPLLATLKMHLEWITNTDNAYNKDKILQHSVLVIDNAIASVKEIANNLSPHILHRFGLINAVTSYIEYIKKTSRIEFIVSSNLKERVQADLEIILYRIVLECVANTIKHSDAGKVILKFDKVKDTLSIFYSDNGKGFDVKKVMAEGKGMGLFNMQSRMQHVGGEIEIHSTPGVGTDITIRINI